MTREEAIVMWVIPALENTWNEKRCNEVLEALDQEHCTDAISRQAAIDLADELKDDLPDDDRLSDMVMSHNEGVLEYQTKLSLLPSVYPKPKTGRWIKHFDDLFPAESYIECSVCGDCEPLEISDNFCPHCGAKMQEVEE